MKKFTFLLLLLFLYAATQALPWGHRYDVEQANQNITVDINTSFRVSVEWGEGDWDGAMGSAFGYGTSTDGTNWTWIELPWFEDGEGSNKRCRADVSISTPGKYYYAYRMIKAANGGTSYSFGSTDWAENLADLNATSTIIVGEVSKTDGSWANPDTWEDGTKPTNSDNVAIMHDVNISSNGEAKSLYVYSGKIFTIEDNGNITITDDLTNNGTFTIQSNLDGTGSLITTNGPISGSVTFQRYIVGYPDATHGWHFLSSPIETFNIAGSAFDPGADDVVYGWDETTGIWMNSKAGDPTQIVSGTGYLTSWKSTDTKNFSGNLNNSNIPKSNLSFTDGSSYSGWHLLGNPFPCALLWDATSWSRSNVNANAKIWNESNASYSDISQNGIIPATQGFMVYVTGSTNSLTIPTADRTHNSQAWYKDVDVNTIKLTAIDPEGSTAQESIIKFNENSTTGFDNEFDSYFLAGYAPQFYSVINDVIAVSTNTLPEISEQLSIPFSFIKNSSSNFYIEAEGLENIFPQTLVSLVDLKTNTTQNLLENPVYTFESSEGDDAERFLIQFGVLGLEEENLENKLNFYIYNNTLNIVNNDLQAGTIQLFDMIGQKVMEKNYSSADNSININLPSAYYIVRIISGKNIVNGKIHID
ncbi:MAG: T9SS type A sorting domain-containing protein [Bacteroidales bacterium]|nr:T9SS type A sorting domain-containing protein [Bacteroidales bacterium]